MKLTIDTQHDSYDDIKKVLHILMNILDKKGQNIPVGFSAASFSSNDDGALSSGYGNERSAAKESMDTSNLMSMFDAPASSNANSSASSSSFLQKEVPNTPPDFSSFLSLTKPPERREETPKIEFY